MTDKREYEESNVLAALRTLLASISSTGVTEDPLALVCKSLVEGVSDFRFAYYCYDHEETGRIAARQKGLNLFLPPPDVERKIATYLRRRTRGGIVAEIDPDQSLSLLSADQRGEWKCHRVLAVRVGGAGTPSAVLALYLDPDFVVERRHKRWVSLFGDATTALLARRESYLRALTARDLETGAISDSFNDHATEAWVRAGLKSPRVKAIVGVRGASKSGLLRTIRRRVIASGVDESRVVMIDFEDARFRRFKTAADVMSYLSRFPVSKKPNYLFLDEVGMIEWHTELLSRLATLKGWNVWLAASTAHAVTFPKGSAASKELSVYRAWTDPNRPRSRADLEKIWCQIFMRDVVSGVDHPDIRAKETLAEYFSDHLGEEKSLREISEELKGVGRPLARSSISAYRQALIDAYLIEISEFYDLFEKRPITSVGGRAFYTDLELRTWRYGSAPEDDARRLALNRFYLKLRRRYDKVYTPRDSNADFVTIEPNGKPRLWRLPAKALK